VRTLLQISSLTLLSGTALAAFPDATPVTVETTPPTVLVVGSKYDARRDDTASRIVVGHDEIVRYGDDSLTDVLKRLPGISIGRASGVPGQGDGGQSQISMRGLGQGYTQLLLLDGVPAPAGFALDTLAPELIERIEVMRAASAELGNQAIAGTINIILKKAVLADRDEAKLGVTRSNGHSTSTLALQLSDRHGRFSYALAASLSRKNSRTDSIAREQASDGAGAPLLLRITPQQEVGRRDEASLAPRLTWALSNGDTLTAQNYLSLTHINNHHTAHESTPLGAPSAYPDSLATYVATSAILRSDVNWTHDLAAGASLDIKAGVNLSRRRAMFHFDGRAVDGGAGSHQVASGPAETGLTFSGNWHRPLGAGHTLTLGWDGADQRRREYRREQQTFRPAAGGTVTNAPRIDDDYRAELRRLAWFGQDEWQVTPRWALSLGLRWEGLRTVIRGNMLAPVESETSICSPLLQSLWKVTPDTRLRLALTHTFKAPTLIQLVPRRYSTDNNNSALNPDTQGNPALRPERAWGLDGALEHDLGGGALLSAGVFMRRISDVTGERLTQSAGTWTSTPFNQGVATVRGLELEAKLPLRLLMREAPAIDLHANLARYWSRVADVAGPDNRLARQTPLSANFGLDYRPRGAALALGGNLSFTGAGPVQESARLRSGATPRRELDVYAVWSWNAKTRWRFSGANLLRRDSVAWQRYQEGYGGEGGVLQNALSSASDATWRLTLERQF
jgi:outer membrane receptor protein involved in Fe transport